MAYKALIVAFSLTAAAPAVASVQAPAASDSALYCMKVEAFTGSRIEQIRCWTRAEWAWQGVDVDKEWAHEGVRVIEA